MIVYADDIVLLAPSELELQLLLDTFITEASKISLDLNNEKTKYMLFKANENKQSIVQEITINNKSIERVFEFKYLGFNVNHFMQC